MILFAENYDQNIAEKSETNLTARLELPIFHRFFVINRPHNQLKVHLFYKYISIYSFSNVNIVLASKS